MAEKRYKEQDIEKEMAKDPCFKAVVEAIQTDPVYLVVFKREGDSKIDIVISYKLYEDIDFSIKSINEACNKFVYMKLSGITTVNESYPIRMESVEYMTL